MGNDYIIKATAGNGLVRATAITARDIAERARNIQKTLPVATAALGRTLAAVSMLGAGLKSENESVTIRIKGDGPLGSIVAVSDGLGNPRGYVQNPQIDLPLRRDGKLDVGRAVGNGLISVTKDLNMRQPFSGQVSLISGEIADDIAAYFAESEQIPTACALGVLVDTDQSVAACGGYIIQLMPGADSALIDKIEQSVLAAGTVTPMLSKGVTPEKMLEMILGSLSLEILSKSEVEYKCSCNRERVARALISMGRDEIISLINEKHPAEISCQFCDSVYYFDENQLRQLLECI